MRINTYTGNTSGLCSSGARSPLATYFYFWVTKKFKFLHQTYKLDALHFKGLEIWAPKYFS